MLTPYDEETLARLVGPGVTLSDEFKEEYKVRLRMMHSAGHSGPLGAQMLVLLVRQFHVEPLKTEPEKPVSDWNQIQSDTRIMFQGRPGRFKGVIGGGLVGMVLDGERAIQEVPSSQITLAPAIVSGVSNETFVDESDPLTAEQAAMNRLPQSVEFDDDQPVLGDDIPVIDEDLMQKWGAVEAGAKVTVDGKVGEFVDLLDSNKLAVLVGDEIVEVEPELVGIASDEE